MLLSNLSNRVYLAAGVTDMRKSIDDLALIVNGVMELDPFSESLFVFCNRERNKLKILHWQTNGFWLYYRRREKGQFNWPGVDHPARPEPLKTFGHESSCKLDIIPASVKVIEYRRLKYACAREECVKTAPLPKSPIPKSIATPGLLAWIIVSKYCDVLPLYRQEGILKRMAIDISRATMAGMHHFRFCHDFISFFNSRQTVVSEYSTICFGLHQKRMSLQ